MSYNLISQKDFFRPAGLELIKSISKQVADRVSCPVVCAGGALRDIRWEYWNIKDIDIFLLSDDPDDVERASGNWSILNTDGDYNKDKGNPKFQLLTCELQNVLYPIQIIRHMEHRTVHDLVNNFDYDLVKAYYDPVSDEAFFHKDADAMYEAKAVKVLYGSNTHQRVNRFFRRNNLHDRGWKIDEIKDVSKRQGIKSAYDEYSKFYTHTTTFNWTQIRPQK